MVGQDAIIELTFEQLEHLRWQCMKLGGLGECVSGIVAFMLNDGDDSKDGEVERACVYTQSVVDCDSVEVSDKWLA